MKTLRSAERERCPGTSIIRIIRLILILLFASLLLCLLQKEAEEEKGRRPLPSPPYPPPLPSSVALEPVSLNSLHVSSFSGLSNAIRRANRLKVTVHVQLHSNIAFKRCILDGGGRFPIFIVNTTSTSSSSTTAWPNADTIHADGGSSSAVIASAFLVTASSELSIPACEVILKNIVVKRAQGGVLHGRCSFTALNSVFEENVVDEDGGAVLTIPGDDSVVFDHIWDLVLVYIRHCTFVRNTAVNGNGGAILSLYGVRGMWLDIAHTVFVGNSARNGSGGAISSQKKDRIFLRNTSFEGNVANDSGGAIYIGGYYDSSFSSVDSVFSNNRAVHGEGGAVAVFEFPCIHMHFCQTSFRGNHAAKIGGKGSSGQDNNLTDENMNTKGTTADRNVAATPNDNGGAAKGTSTEEDEGIVVKKWTSDSSDDVFMQGTDGSLREHHQYMGYSRLHYCPRVPHSGVRVFLQDDETDQIHENLLFVQQDCEQCSGCEADCNNHGLCLIPPYSKPMCKCEYGYDPSYACGSCLPGFKNVKANKGSPSSCSPCAGIDQIPATPDNEMLSSVTSTIEPSLKACIAHFEGTHSGTMAYFTGDAVEECRHACVIVSKHLIDPCAMRSKLHFLPHLSMYYLEIKQNYTGCM